MVDRGLSEAGRSVQQKNAPYIAEVGTCFRGNIEDGDDKLPLIINFEVTLKLAADYGSGRIAQMDRHQIDMQVLSCSNPPQDTPFADEVALTRAANNKLAEAIREHPTRFSGFASLPWQHPEEAAQELKRSVEELGLVGAILLGRPGEVFLDDARFEPVLAALHTLKVPLYIHPGYPLPQVQQPYYGGLGKEITARMSLFGWGWHNEAGIQLLRVLLSGKFDRFPNLQVISGHWGEMVPFYLQRLDDMIPPEVSKLSRSITDTFRQHVYVTPSGMMNTPHFEFIKTVLGVERILYSVDYPYLTLAGARRFLETLAISEDDKEKIAYKNAEALFRM